MRKKLSILLLLFLSSAAPAEEKLPFFPLGEQLYFNIAWGFINAGSAQIVAAQSPSGQHQLRAYAWNNGFFESIYSVSDTIITTIDREKGLPTSFSKILNEGGWHSRSQIDFEQQNRKAHLTDTVFDGKGVMKPGRGTDTTVVLDGPSFDILSAFFHFRTLDLQVGKSHELLAVSGKKKYRLKVLVHRKERVEVPAGSYDCIVVEPILADDGLFKANGKMTIWLSDDEQRIPVLVRTKIALGSIRVELTDRVYRGGF